MKDFLASMVRQREELYRKIERELREDPKTSLRGFLAIWHSNGV